MVRCDVQRWKMQKQIDATWYIIPCKTDDRTSIIVLQYARHRMRIESQGHLTLWHHSTLRCDVTPHYAVTSLRVTLSRDFSPDRHPAIGHIHVKMVTLALEHTLNMRHAFHTTHKCETRQDILYVKCCYSPCMVSSESLLNSYRRMASFSSICVEIVHGSPENNQKKKSETYRCYWLSECSATPGKRLFLL
jgi:hypothetical protein